MSEAMVAFAGSAGRVRESVKCRTVRARLPGELLGTWPLSPSAHLHLERCLTCQAQAARYRTVLRALRLLRDGLEDAPAWIVSEVLGSLDEAGSSRDSKRTAAWAVSAVAASLAAAVAIALMRAIRSGAI